MQNIILKNWFTVQTCGLWPVYYVINKTKIQHCGANYRHFTIQCDLNYTDRFLEAGANYEYIMSII